MDADGELCTRRKIECLNQSGLKFSSLAVELAATDSLAHDPVGAADCRRRETMGWRLMSKHRPYILPFLITLAAVALAGVVAGRHGASTWDHPGPVMLPFAPMAREVAGSHCGAAH